MCLRFASYERALIPSRNPLPPSAVRPSGCNDGGTRRPVANPRPTAHDWLVREVDVSILKVTDETTRAELEEAIANLNATLHRMPKHWTERRAKLHARIDALLVDWERAT